MGGGWNRIYESDSEAQAERTGELGSVTTSVAAEMAGKAWTLRGLGAVGGARRALEGPPSDDFSSTRQFSASHRHVEHFAPERVSDGPEKRRFRDAL